MKMKTALLLLLFLSASAHANSNSGLQPKKPTGCGDRNQISNEFREVAGNAFDKVQAMQWAELNRQFYYETILTEAEFAVIDAHRKATNPDENNLYNCINDLKIASVKYRSDTEKVNVCRILTLGPPVCFTTETSESLNESKEHQKDISEAIRESLKVPR
jgi:hypothetical protein